MAAHLGLPQSRIDELYQVVSNLEKLKDAADLTRLLVP